MNKIRLEPKSLMNEGVQTRTKVSKETVQTGGRTLWEHLIELTHTELLSEINKTN